MCNTFQCDLLRGNRNSVEFLWQYHDKFLCTVYWNTVSTGHWCFFFFWALLKHLSLISHQMDIWCIEADWHYYSFRGLGFSEWNFSLEGASASGEWLEDIIPWKILCKHRSSTIQHGIHTGASCTQIRSHCSMEVVVAWWTPPNICTAADCWPEDRIHVLCFRLSEKRSEK